MSGKSTRVLRLLAITIFALGVVTTGVGYLVKHARTETQPAFTMTSEQTFTGTDGKTGLTL